MKKRKILLLSDHLLSTSGVGCQSRFLTYGLVKTGKWSVRQLGAAIKHENYDGYFPNNEWEINGDKLKMISGNPQWGHTNLPERNLMYRNELLKYLFDFFDLRKA